VKSVIKELVPPIVLKGMKRLRNGAGTSRLKTKSSVSQDLDVYWDPNMADELEVWGEGNAWTDIQLLMAGRSGKVLDIACGTGKVMDILGMSNAIEIHGCDISDLLISRAHKRNINPDRVSVQDATKMNYPDSSFDLAYSIGSLEHFTEDGISKFFAECLRVVKGPTFHMVPMSRRDIDEGWITTSQSYFNNSAAWWRTKCLSVYPAARFLPSTWRDEISVGCWMMCMPKTGA
jgi:ubiquinone/menaquinone biosynthesis C-methylase UbiE